MISLRSAPISAATCRRAVSDRVLGLPAEAVVAAAGVAVDLGEVRQHRLDDAGSQRPLWRESSAALRSDRAADEPFDGDSAERASCPERASASPPSACARAVRRKIA
jgi:hypothetical protein